MFSMYAYTDCGLFFFYVSFPSLYKQCLAQKILNAVHPEECDFTFFFVDVPSSIEGGQ